MGIGTIMVEANVPLEIKKAAFVADLDANKRLRRVDKIEDKNWEDVWVLQNVTDGVTAMTVSVRNRTGMDTQSPPPFISFYDRKESDSLYFEQIANISFDTQQKSFQMALGTDGKWYKIELREGKDGNGKVVWSLDSLGWKPVDDSDELFQKVMSICKPESD